MHSINIGYHYFVQFLLVNISLHQDFLMLIIFKLKYKTDTLSAKQYFVLVVP